jgi:P-type Cu2+ transporter
MKGSMASKNNHSNEKKNHGTDGENEGGNHQDHHAHMVAEFKRRFWALPLVRVPMWPCKRPTSF